VSRLILDFFIVSALLAGGIFMVVAKDTIVVSVPESVASSTPAAQDGDESNPFYPIVFTDTNVQVAETKPAVSEKTAPQEKKPELVAPTPASVVETITKTLVVAPAATTTAESAPLIDAATLPLRNALVNIVCYVPLGLTIHSISGSGVLVDPKGIILTNAHIAQYFLLRDRGVSCTVRAGSPATDAYKASLIFISRAWIEENADLLVKPVPYGTGEHDFAFLAVTKSASVAGKALPEQFPFIPLANTVPTQGTPVVIGGYAAQFLAADQIQSALYPTLVFGSVKDVFTFVKNTVDVISLGGSAAAQQGSSGGGVADANGSLIGTIVTSTQEKVTSDRSLDAITAGYIRNAYEGEAGESLDVLLSRPVAASISQFETTKKELETVLLKVVQ
jgi:S1-C subfamily serine protease